MTTKKVTIATMAWLVLSLASQNASAQVPVVSLVSGIIKKVIIALDLKVQELENQTIALQDAEANVENNLHRSSLNDIGSWLGKERDLYQQYYQELASVRQIIADYDEVKRVISEQKELVSEYHSASTLFHADRHFSVAELRQMDAIYRGILQESVRNLDEVMTAVQGVGTQMTDAERFTLIHNASAGMQRSLDHLRRFNDQNLRLSLARTADTRDRAVIRAWYGLP